MNPSFKISQKNNSATSFPQASIASFQERNEASSYPIEPCRWRIRPGTMELASFRDLPEELLRIVFCLCSTADLATLTLCSSELRKLVTPYLYEHVEAKTQWHQGRLWSGTSSHFRFVASLLIDQPHLAQLVHRFSLVSVEETRPIRSVKNRADPVFGKATEHLIVPRFEPNLWLQDLGECAPDNFILALLLRNLPNVHSLQLCSAQSRFLARSFLHASQLDASLPEISFLKQLRHVTLTTPFVQETSSPDTLAALFRMPFLRWIRCHNLKAWEVDRKNSPLVALDAYSSGVTRLEVLGRSLPHQELVDALRIPKSLVTFVFGDWPRDSSVYLPVSRIHQAFAQQKHALENLWLGSLPTASLLPSYRRNWAIAGFAHMTKLKRLGLAPEYLMGRRYGLVGKGHDDLAANPFLVQDGDLEDNPYLLHDEDSEDDSCLVHDEGRARLRNFLPPSLETLAVSPVVSCGEAPNPLGLSKSEHVIRALKDIVSDRPPSLRAIRLEGNFMLASWLWRSLVEFVELCNARDIKICIIHTREVYAIPYHPASPTRTDHEMWDASGRIPRDGLRTECVCCRRTAQSISIQDLYKWIDDPQSARDPTFGCSYKWIDNPQSALDLTFD